MITPHGKLLGLGTAVLLIALGSFFLWPRLPAPKPKQWLLVSAPVFASRLTPTGAIPTVILIISNAGPLTIDPGLSWFECRTKTGLARLEGNEGWRWFPSLSPGKAMKVACDLPQGFSTGEAPLFCCEITWFERGSLLRRMAQALDGSDNPNIRPWNIDWMRPWQSKPLTNGVAFASNVAVADFFRSVYGIDEPYFERQMQQFKAASATRTQTVSYSFVPFPSREVQLTNSAWEHYLNFRRSL